MKFSNNNTTWSAEQPYTATKSWTLYPGNGANRVYVKFKDNVGNWSTSVSDAILLLVQDTTPPAITHTPITWARKNMPITFTATVADATSGVEKVTLYWRKYIRRIFWWEWSEWRSLSMTQQGRNNRYDATLTTSQVENRKIEYCIAAADKAGNTHNTPKYSIIIR